MKPISTYTQRKVRPIRVAVEDICIEDIARSLALQCRWMGHCNDFYSVAEHSVRVAAFVSLTYIERGHTPEEAREAALVGLMHDATEAYVSDIPTPIKDFTFIKDEGNLHTFREVEALIMESVCKKYQIEVTPEIEEVVKLADDVLLATEARDLTSPAKQPKEWLKGYPDPLPGEIEPWSWREAEARFLNEFYNLCPREEWKWPNPESKSLSDKLWDLVEQLFGNKKEAPQDDPRGLADDTGSD